MLPLGAVAVAVIHLRLAADGGYCGCGGPVAAPLSAAAVAPAAVVAAAQQHCGRGGRIYLMGNMGIILCG